MKDPTLSTYVKLIAVCMCCMFWFPSQLSAQNADTLLLPFDQNGNGEMSRKETKELLRRIDASDKFYKRIKERADSGYIYKQLYPLIFRKPQDAENVKINNLPANATFRRYRGDVIRSVRIIKIDVFGSSIYDTVQEAKVGIINTMNKLHTKTQTAVIMNYLQFKEGDRLDPVKISDNERLIRNAPIFEDARFIIEPVNRDTVDIILVVKDVFPLGVDVKVNSVNNGSLRISNRNIFGFGHQLSQTIGYNNDYSPSFFLSEGSYLIRNISHSFTDFNVFWSDNPLYKRKGFDLLRPFITPETRFAGGLNVTYNQSWLYHMRSIDRFRFNNRLFDVWAGYATITNRLKDISSQRQQIALTGRFYQLDYFQTPHFSLWNQPPMINTTRLLFAFNILRSEYYRTNMLYGYGRTEDLPFGHHAELVFGWENNQLQRRIYTALKLELVQPTKHAGMIGLDFQIGGYLNGGFYEDGILKAQLKMISPLMKAGRHHIRNFGFVGYTTGLDRKIPGVISINDGNSGNLFNNFELLGYQRLRGRIESVIFTPYYLLGFRFAPFWFAEAAVIAEKNQQFVNQIIYPALGVGIRLKNENLVFSTFQLSFSWHPIAPDDVTKFEFLFSDIPHSGLRRYLIDKPELVEYR